MENVKQLKKYCVC